MFVWPDESKVSRQLGNAFAVPTSETSIPLDLLLFSYLGKGRDLIKMIIRLVLLYKYSQGASTVLSFPLHVVALSYSAIKCRELIENICRPSR